MAEDAALWLETHHKLLSFASARNICRVGFMARRETREAVYGGGSDSFKCTYIFFKSIRVNNSYKWPVMLTMIAVWFGLVQKQIYRASLCTTACQAVNTIRNAVDRRINCVWQCC